VDLSNLHRQPLYDISKLGYPKVEVAAERIRNLNPFIEVEPLPISVNEETAEDIVSGMDVIIDGLDHIEARYEVNRACIKLKVPYVFGAAITTFGNISTIIPEKTPCLECFYGNLSDNQLPTCGEVGVHPSLPTFIASIQVSESIKILTGKEPKLAKKLLYCDIENLTFDLIHLSRAEKCPVCGISKDTVSHSPSKTFVEELCSRNGERVFVLTPKKPLEIDMKHLRQLLSNMDLNVKLKTKMSTTFSSNQKNEIVLLESGIMIMKGIKEKNSAIDLYEKIMRNLD
jgi:adenylyltransferase/sulfurtransferase